MPMLTPSLLDLKLGARMLLKYPGLTLVGGLGMAVAIAVAGGFFSVMSSFVSPTIPLDDGDRLVGLENWDTVANNEQRRALHDFVTWRAEMKTVVEMSAFRNVGRNLSVEGGGVEPITVAEITASGLRTARVSPMLGRLLVEDDEQTGAAPVLVIGYDAWRTRFASDPAVVGRIVRMDTVPHTIVGVMPEAFAFPMNHQFWAPFRADPAVFARGEGPDIFIFGRLAPGASRESAQAELSTIGARAAAEFPTTHARLRPQALPYTYPLTDRQDMTLWQAAMMQLTVTTLLLVVAANVAVLVYARTATRRREIALRTAIGASRTRLIVQLFAEAFVLATLAGAVGLAIADVGLQQAYAIVEEEVGTLPFWTDQGLSPTLIGAFAVLILVTTLIIGLVPAIQATGRTLSSSLPQLAGLGMRLGGTWTVLIVAQVAVAMCALPIAIGIGWKGAREGLTAPVFPAQEFLIARVETGDAANARSLAEVLRTLDVDPAIEAVSFTDDVPGGEDSAAIEVAGGAPAAALDAQVGRVAIDLFGVLGVPMLAGRAFAAADTGAAASTVIVNRAFAERAFRGENALGRRVRFQTESGGQAQPGTWYEIVGVVGDLYANRFGRELVRPAVYRAIAIPQNGGIMLTMRVRGMPPGEFTPRFREIVTTVDPALRFSATRTFDSLDRQQRIAVRLVTVVLGFVTASVLLLSAAGVYAMMSFTVSQRRKEIGIRAALGAEPRRLLRSLFSRAVGQLAAGLALGAVAVLVIDVLSGGETLGGAAAVIIPAIALLMTLAGMLATVGPARRGLRVDTTEALKAE